MTKPSLLETVSEFSSTISFSSVSEQSKSFVKVLRGLLVLQDISALISACKDGDYGREKLFFTSLASVCTISDCLLRKIRGILLSVSLDCTRLELLGDGNLKLPTEKPKEKSNASSRRKKGKARKFKGMNLASSAAAHDKSVKVLFIFLQLFILFFLGSASLGSPCWPIMVTARNFGVLFFFWGGGSRGGV